jgi:hypothetical protein
MEKRREATGICERRFNPYMTIFAIGKKIGKLLTLLSHSQNQGTIQ